jgi:RNA polymerase sigma-70 factor (ECF subfamily)
MTNGPPDESLFVKYRADGDLEAFGRLYDRYGPAVFRFLLRLLHDRPAAEDLTQQVFLRVHESRGAFDARRRFRTWIFTIARRLAANCAARGGSTVTEADPPDVEDAAPSPEHRAIVRDEARAVERALSSLSRDDAGVLLLAKYEGLSYEEIGGVVGCSADAAKMRVHRALKRLAEQLAEPREKLARPLKGA